MVRAGPGAGRHGFLSSADAAQSSRPVRRLAGLALSNLANEGEVATALVEQGAVEVLLRLYGSAPEGAV